MIKDYAVTAEFRSKSPYTTSWLEISYHTEAPPTVLIEQLAEAGWREDGMWGIPPRSNGRTEVILSRPGTGLFRSWTPEEKKAAMADARKILRRHRVYTTTRKMTLADLL